MSPEKFEEWLKINSFSEKFLNVIDANMRVITLESVRNLYALLTPRWVKSSERLPARDGSYLIDTTRGETYWLDHYIPPLPEVEV